MIFRNTAQRGDLSFTITHFSKRAIDNAFISSYNESTISCTTEERLDWYVIDANKLNLRCDNGRDLVAERIDFVHKSRLGELVNSTSLPFIMERCYIRLNIAAFLFLKGGYMSSFSIDQIFVGQHSTLSKTFYEADVYMFAQVTGDKNPVHLDDEYAKQSMFQQRIVHGFFVGSMFSQIIGNSFPGLGTVYTFQSLKFTKPVYFGDTITATVSAKELLIEKNRVVLECIAHNQEGQVVLIGEAFVMPPKKGNL
jgi:3-hydroxybutyryl-CoA dehydratase